MKASPIIGLSSCLTLDGTGYGSTSRANALQIAHLCCCRTPSDAGCRCATALAILATLEALAAAAMLTSRRARAAPRSTSLDVLLQQLVDRRLLASRVVPSALALCVAVCALFSVPVLLLDVSDVGAITSFLLGYLREKVCLRSAQTPCASPSPAASSNPRLARCRLVTRAHHASQRAASNFVMALAFAQTYEVATLLINRYSLVFD